jgi:hypothetical protein
MVLHDDRVRINQSLGRRVRLNTPSNALISKFNTREIRNWNTLSWIIVTGQLTSASKLGPEHFRARPLPLYHEERSRKPDPSRIPKDDEAKVGCGSRAGRPTKPPKWRTDHLRSEPVIWAARKSSLSLVGLWAKSPTHGIWRAPHVWTPCKAWPTASAPKASGGKLEKRTRNGDAVFVHSTTPSPTLL